MARKNLKLTRSKGERLGWTPIDQVKCVQPVVGVITAPRLPSVIYALFNV